MDSTAALWMPGLKCCIMHAWTQVLHYDSPDLNSPDLGSLTGLPVVSLWMGEHQLIPGSLHRNR